MIWLDKIRAFFKGYAKGMGFLEPKPEAKAAEKKGAEPSKTKAAEAPEKKGDESSSK